MQLMQVDSAFSFYCSRRSLSVEHKSVFEFNKIYYPVFVSSRLSLSTDKSMKMSSTWIKVNIRVPMIFDRSFDMH